MKHPKHLLAAAAAAAMVFTGTHLTAHAYTPDDVAAKARQAGWPDYLIQMGYNEWSSGDYTQNELDKAYESVSGYDTQTKEMICNYFGVDPDDVPDPEPAAPTEAASPVTEAPTEGGTSAGVTGGDTSGNTTGGDTSGNTTGGTSGKGDESLIVTKTDGTTEQRVSKTDFINMTYEEKKAYVDTLTEESKAAFVGSLSTAEKNSMIKQMPTAEKAALMQTYIDAAGTMGVNVTVDQLTGDNISLTMRDDEGKVVGMTNVGITIDETGISHTLPYGLAAAAAVAALLGFAQIGRTMRREDR